MSELQQSLDALSAQANKYERESDFLLGQIERLEQADNLDLEAVRLVLSEAKRVRRESNLLVRALAQLRDDLQPKEAQGND